MTRADYGPPSFFARVRFSPSTLDGIHPVLVFDPISAISQHMGDEYPP